MGPLALNAFPWPIARNTHRMTLYAISLTRIIIPSDITVTTRVVTHSLYSSTCLAIILLSITVQTLFITFLTNIRII